VTADPREPPPALSAEAAGNGAALLTYGSVPRRLYGMAASMMIGFAAAAAFNFVDTYYVSKLGTDALAAMGYTFPVVMTILSLAMGIGVGTASVLSRTIGEGNPEQIRRVTVDALMLALGLAAVFVAVGLLTLEPLLRALGATGEPLALAERYLRIWYPGVLFVIVPMVGNHAIRATGDTLSPSLIMTVDLGLNAALDPILIFGAGPIPPMGIEGAAWATVGCRALSLGAALYVLGRRKHMLALLRPKLAEVLDSWRRILYIALPVTGAHLLVPVTMGILTRTVAGFGTETMAAFSAGIRIERCAVIPLMALGTSMVPFVGQNFGRRLGGRIRQALRIAFWTCLGWGAFCVVGLAALAGPLGTLFTDDPAVQAPLATLLYILPLAFAMRGILHSTLGSLNAINRPVDCGVLNAVRLMGLQVPLALAGAAAIGFPGLLGGIVLGEGISMVLAVVWLRRLLAVHLPAGGV